MQGPPVSLAGGSFFPGAAFSTERTGLRCWHPERMGAGPPGVLRVLFGVAYAHSKKFNSPVESYPTCFPLPFALVSPLRRPRGYNFLGEPPGDSRCVTRTREYMLNSHVMRTAPRIPRPLLPPGHRVRDSPRARPSSCPRLREQLWPWFTGIRLWRDV